MTLLGIDWQMAAAVWSRNAIVYRRTWLMNVFPNFFEPLLYLVGMGFGLGAYVGQDLGGRPYAAWIAPGLMAAAAMNGATFETTYNVFVKMTFGRLYDAFLGTPAQIEDIVAGELLWATTRGLLYGGVFMVAVAVAHVAGLRIIESPWAILLPVAFTLIGALFAAIGALFTSVVRSIDAYNWYFTLFLTPLFLFSGIFYPVDRFAGAEAVAWCTPLFHAVRVCRGLTTGDVGAEVLVSTAWMLVVTAAACALIPSRLRLRLSR
jgi:lipooligosaccharide transport system permease protein